MFSIRQTHFVPVYFWSELCIWMTSRTPDGIMSGSKDVLLPPLLEIGESLLIDLHGRLLLWKVL